MATKQDVLNLFASIKGQKWISGQQVHDNFSDLTFDNNVGVKPGIVIADFNMDSQPFSTAATQNIKNYAAQGGIVGHSPTLMSNPITGNSNNDTSGINAAQMTTVGTAQYNSLIALIDTYAAALQPYLAAGIPILCRLFHEMDIGVFWWNTTATDGAGNFTFAQFRTLYQIVHDRLLVTHGLTNLIFVFSTNGNSTSSGLYPGDAYVDVVGFDAYNDDIAGVYGPKYDAMQAMAPNKPICIAEFGSGDPGRGDINYNVSTLINDIATRMPNIVYVNAWSGGARGVGNGWNWAQYQNVGALNSTPVMGLGSFTLGSTVTTPPATGTTTDPFTNPGGDGLFVRLPFQTTAQWIAASDARCQAIRTLPGHINIGKTDWVAPFWVGSASDPLVTITDGSYSFQARVPAGAYVEGNGNTGDTSIGGSDRTQPYLGWSANGVVIDGSASNVVTNGSTITCGGLLIYDLLGPVLEDAVTNLPGVGASDNCTYAAYTDAEIVQMSNDPNFFPKHMMTLEVWSGALSASTVWPVKFSDPSLTGPCPEGATLGIPASVTPAASQSRAYYQLFNQMQQFGALIYNTTGQSVNIMANAQSSAALSYATNQLAPAWALIVPLLQILKYDGSAGSQFSVSTAKGMIGGARSDAFQAPPQLDLTATNGTIPSPSSWHAWYGSDSKSIFYTTPGTVAAAPGSGGGGGGGSGSNPTDITYIPQFRPHGTTVWTSLPAQSGTSVVITGLTPGSPYDFDVISQDSFGSTTSVVVTDTTTGAVIIPGDSVGVKASRIADMMERFGFNIFSDNGSGNTFGSFPANYTIASVTAAYQFLMAGSGMICLSRGWCYQNYNLLSPYCPQLSSATGTKWTMEVGGTVAPDTTGYVITMAGESHNGTGNSAGKGGWLLWSEGFNEPNNLGGETGTQTADGDVARASGLSGYPEITVMSASPVFSLPNPEGVTQSFYGSDLSRTVASCSMWNVHYYPSQNPDFNDGSTRNGEFNDVFQGINIGYGVARPQFITEWHPTLYSNANPNFANGGWDDAHDSYLTPVYMLSAFRLGYQGYIWYALYDFGVTAGTRNASDIPFSETSIWNIGIGSNATWGSSSDADVSQLRGLNGGINAGNFGQPIYFGKSTDPLVTFTCQGKGPRGDVPWSTQMHCPANAQPAAGTDEHMSVYDATQPHKAVTMLFATFNNGTDVTGGVGSYLGSILDLTKNGLFAASGDFVGTDDYLAGVITDYDIAQGAIKHMVRIAISRNASKSPNQTQGSAQNVPWPNDHVDYDAPSTYTGQILGGVTFGIPASVNINNLGLSAGGLMLAKCLQDYGGVWRDSAGTSQCVFYSTPELEGNATIGQMRGDMPKIMSVLNIMRNQSSDGSAGTINGGGTSRAPLLPPLA